MLIDFLFLSMMVMALYKGFRNGLIIGIFATIGWVIGLIAAIRFSDVAAEFLRSSLDLSPRLISIIAFIAVFSLVMLLVNLGARLIEKTVELALMGWLNKLGGIIFYVLLYTFIFCVVIYFADKVKILSRESVASSKVYHTLQPVFFTLKQLF